MKSKERPTMLERLLEMVRERGGIANDRPEPGGPKTERDHPITTRKKEKKQKKAAQSS